MKKSKLFGMAAMAAMMLGSCSTDEVVNDYSPENAIQFGTYVGRDAVSRGSIITAEGGTDANTGIVSESLRKEGFGVFAYYTDNSTFVSTSTPNFMYNQKVEGVYTLDTNGDKVYTPGAAWTYSPLKYWPNESDDKVSFFAYAPYTEQPIPDQNGNIVPHTMNIGNHSTNTAEGTPSLTFYVASDVNDQVDLLWATPVLNQIKQATNENIQFTFNHALSRIGFSVQTMLDTKNEDADGTADDADRFTNEYEKDQNGDQITTVKVTKVELSGKFYNAGTLQYSESNDNYVAFFDNCTTPANGITYVLEEENFETVKDNVPTTKTKLNKDDSYIMIIPKDFAVSSGNDDAAGETLKVKVTYTVTTKDNNLDTGETTVTNVIETAAFNMAEGFTAGKAYNFCLHLGLTSVKLSATVTAWDEQNSDYAVNVPLNITNP